MKLKACSAALALVWAAIAPANAQEMKAEVIHWWTSGGESAAVKVFAEQFAKAGGTWVDTAIAGGANAQTGETVALGWLDRDMGNLTGGINISTWILIVHGWFYVVYLFSCFRLWLLMRWGLPQLIVMALGGVVPFLSFIVEKRIHRETLELLDANPQATKRY